MDAQSFPKNQEDLNKVVTLGVLLEYTDEFLVPKIQEIVSDTIDDAIAKSENRMMDYLDRQLTDHTAELFRKLEQKFQTERQFKDKVVELFRRHNIGTSEDIAFLDGLVKGGW